MASAVRPSADRTVRRVAIPSDRAWFDPQLVLANCELEIVDVTMTALAEIRLLPADPQRLLAWFVFVGAGANDVDIAPYPNLSGMRLDVVGSANNPRYTLFEHPCIVQAEWYGISSGNGSQRILTVRRS